MNITIRPETANDIAAIYTINELAFERADEAKLVDAIREGGAFIPALSLVAEVNGQLVGHILFSDIAIVQDSGRLLPSLALAPMAVLPEWQGKGVGAALVREGLAQAQAAGYPSVMVLGHEKYYPKFGFEPAAQWHIQAPFEVPAAAFMGIALQPGALDDAAGTVHYPREFDEV